MNKAGGLMKSPLQAVAAAAILLSATVSVHAAPIDDFSKQNSSAESGANAAQTPGNNQILAPIKQVPDWINQQAESLRDKMHGKQPEHSDTAQGTQLKPIDGSRLAQQFDEAKQSVQTFFRDANDNWTRITTGFRDGGNYLLDQLDSLANWTRRQVASARNYL
jgi:hypothetical protein